MGQTMEVTEDTVDSLAHKMDNFGQTLSEDEYAVLLGLLRAARKALASEEAAGNLPTGGAEGEGQERSTFVMERHAEKMAPLSLGIRQALPMASAEVSGYDWFTPGIAGITGLAGPSPLEDDSISVQWSKSFGSFF